MPIREGEGSFISSDDEFKTEFKINFPGIGNNLGIQQTSSYESLKSAEFNPLFHEMAIKEIRLKESLLTPSLLTTIHVQHVVNKFYKNLDLFYNQDVVINLEKKALARLGRRSKLDLNQKIYKLTDRKSHKNNIENFTLHACDYTLLEDGKTFTNISTEEGNCHTPSWYVEYILRNCAKANSLEIEETTPPQDFAAENLHPFAAVAKLADRASSTKGRDPSLLHYMTYQNQSGASIATHNFKSITRLAEQGTVWEYINSDKVSTKLNLYNPNEIMDYSFPCEFDLLSDTLNGMDETGAPTTSINVFQPLTGQISVYGLFGECGNNPNMAFMPQTIQGCPVDNTTWMLYRKHRMAMIDTNHIALKMMVSFNPNLNVGRTIDVKFMKYHTGTGNTFEQYGSGKYMIVNMTHSIKADGFGTTMLDCVSQSVARGKI